MTDEAQGFFRGLGIFILVSALTFGFVFVNVRVDLDRNNKIALDTQKKLQIEAVKAGVATWVIAEDGSTTFTWISTNKPSLEK